MIDRNGGGRARLAGKVALVTGAGPGLGGVIAQAMAAESAKLVVCDIAADTRDATQARLAALGAETARDRQRVRRGAATAPCGRIANGPPPGAGGGFSARSS